MPLRTDFTTRNIVDPAAQLSNVLAGLQGQLSNYEKQKLAEQEAALLAQHRAGQAERAERQLSLSEKEAKRRTAQDEALGKALLGIDPTMTSTTIVPATTKEEVANKAAIEAATKTQSEAGSQYGQLFEEELAKLQKARTTPTGTVNLGDIIQPSTVVAPDMFTSEELAPHQAGFDPTTAVRDVTATAPLGELATFSPEIFKGKTTEVPSSTTGVGLGLPVDSSPEMVEQASQLALQRAGIIDKSGKSVLPLIPEKEVKTVTVPEKEVTSKLSKSEWLSRELEKAKDLKLGGAAAKNYHDVLTKRADQLYGEQKPMTLGDQLKLFKYQQEQKTQKLTMQDYENMYPSQKGKIKTLDGWKAYEGKVGKAANKKFNLAEDLYKTMIGKDSGDVDAIFKFLSKNNEKLGNMLPDELRTLSAQLKAKYAGESGWDISDFLGGSAAGDVLGDITLK